VVGWRGEQDVVFELVCGVGRGGWVGRVLVWVEVERWVEWGVGNGVIGLVGKGLWVGVCAVEGNLGYELWSHGYGLWVMNDWDEWIFGTSSKPIRHG